MPVEDPAYKSRFPSRFQSEEEFTDQRSSHFKLCIAVNFKSLWKKPAPSFDLPFGTVIIKLKLFYMIERKCTMLDEINCHL